MNISWILAGLMALITGVGRSYSYFANLSDQLVTGTFPDPVVSWFITVWFIVSGLFLFTAIVYFTIGIKPQRFASIQIATLLNSLFLLVWLIIATINLWAIDSPTLQPLYPIAIIVGLGLFGAYRQKIA